MKEKQLFKVTAVLAFTVFLAMGPACASLMAGGDQDESSPKQQQQQAAPPSQQQTAPQQTQQQGAGQQQQTTAAQTTSQYFTGNGGRGTRLGILVPQSQGLGADQEYLPALVQGVLVSNFSKYSAISVLDRVSLDKVITETLDLTYEDDVDIVRLGSVTQAGQVMTGNIIKTSTGFTLQLNVTETTAQANTIASYSGNCTPAELDNHSAINRASLELLQQMKVQLTARARNELNKASETETINAQTALARGVTAQRQGTEVAALSYYLQAAELDPALQEAETRLDILTASITSSMGADASNDIQWRRQWMTRLRETEQFITQFMRDNRSYYLVYSAPTQGAIDYAKETVTLSIDLFSAPDPMSFDTINRLTRTVRNGLIATGRAEVWGLNWPAQSVTTPSPFFANSNNYPVVVEIFNAAGKSVGRKSANLQIGGWFMPDAGALSGTTTPYLRPSVKLDFAGVDVKDVDSLTIRVVSINNVPAERASAQFGLRILPQDEYENTQSIADNGLQAANLRLYDIRFEQGRNMLKGFSGSTYAVIPYGVTHIDNDSGLQRKGLTSVKIPSSVTIIGRSAFYENLLTSVTIPDSVTSIGQEAFYDNRLSNVFIGSSITSIGNRNFCRNSLTSIIIPDNVTSIAEYAFLMNDNLQKITIGANVRLPKFLAGREEPLSSFDNGYNNNNSRAGTYTYNASSRTWSYSASK